MIGSRLLIALAALALVANERPGAIPLKIDGDPAARMEWAQVFASTSDDWVNDLVPVGEGRVAAVGFLNRTDMAPAADWHALFAELAGDGSIVSRHVYGVGGGVDAFWSVVPASDGRRMFAGFTTRVGGGGINGYLLLADSQGRIVKENAFGGGGYDRFTDLAAAPGGYVFLGHSQAEGEPTRRRVFVVKSDANGLPLWERVHDAPQTWGALYIEPAGDGGFIIAGGTTAADGDGDMFAIKIDGEGRELWRKRIGTRDWDEINHGLIVRPNGEIVLVGYTHARGAETNDIVAATLNREGETLRLERFGGPGDERAISAKPDSSGRIWIVGQTASSGAGGSDLLLARLDANGGFEPAALTIGGASDDNGTAILPMADGAILLAGYSRNLGVGGQDAFVARLSRPDWSRRHLAFRRTIVVGPRRVR